MSLHLDRICQGRNLTMDLSESLTIKCKTISLCGGPGLLVKGGVRIPAPDQCDQIGRFIGVWATF